MNIAGIPAQFLLITIEGEVDQAAVEKCPIEKISSSTALLLCQRRTQHHQPSLTWEKEMIRKSTLTNNMRLITHLHQYLLPKGFKIMSKANKMILNRSILSIYS